MAGFRKNTKRKDRKLIAKLGKQLTKRGRGKREEDDTPETPKRVRKPQKESGLLIEPHRSRSDIKLVEQSLRGGWNVKRKGRIRRRLEGILVKTVADVVTKNGVVPSESAADKLAIESAKVLAAMDNADMNRVVEFRKLDSAPPPPEQNPAPTNVNVTVTNVVNNPDNRRIELARLAIKHGDGTLVVDGRTVQATDILGADLSTPAIEGKIAGVDAKPR